MMTRTLVAVALFGLVSVGKTVAQEITNQDLYKYAVVMETQDMFKDELSTQVTDYINQQDPAIKNRYNALAGGEEPANDAEKQFIGQVKSMQSERTGEFSDAFKTMIKRVLGAQTYSAVKKGIANDTEVKERYNTIVQAMRSAADTASASAGE